MSTPALIAEPSTPISELARMMVTSGINRVPIVEGGALLGIATRGDVLRAIAGFTHADDAKKVGSDVIVLGGSATWVGERPAPFSTS